jgi:hypothetical protein
MVTGLRARGTRVAGFGVGGASGQTDGHAGGRGARGGWLCCGGRAARGSAGAPARQPPASERRRARERGHAAGTGHG